MARTTGQSCLLLLFLLYPVFGKNVTLREVTPDETIEALAKQKEDAVKTFNGIFGGTADLMGELLAGEKPSLFDIAKEIVPGLIGLTGDPLLSAVSAYVLSFLGGLFGGWSASLSEEEKIELLVNAALLQEKLRDDNQWLSLLSVNLMRWTNEFQSPKDIDALRNRLGSNIDIMQTNEGNIFSDCRLANAFPSVNQGSQRCLEWSQSGAISLAVNYVSLRLQTEASLAHAHAGDVETVKAQTAEMKSLGKMYKPIIQGMYSIFRTSRLMAIQKPFPSSQDCAASDWATQGFSDNFNGFDFMKGCPGFHTASPSTGKWYECTQDGVSDCHCSEAALKCYNTYVNKIQAELKRLEEKFASIQQIIDIPSQDEMTTTEVVTKRNQSNLRKLHGFDTHVSTEQAENRSKSSSNGIDYCSSPDSLDWCDRSTGTTGLWVWPKGDASKKQAYTMECSSSQSIFVSIPGSCVSWQCFGQSKTFDVCFPQRDYGSGETLLAWSCQSKQLSDTGRLCWKYLPPVPSVSDSIATKSLVV